MSDETDVVVIGGGIIGAAIAERLARGGVGVTLLERGAIGAASSWAAAGLLVPVHPWRYPESMLRLDDESLALWETLAPRLLADTGVDVELRHSGLLALLDSDADVADADRRVAWTTSRGRQCERLSQADLARRTSVLAPDLRGALWMSDVAQIRNPRAAPALARAAATRGARVVEHVGDVALVAERGVVVGARTSGPNAAVYHGRRVVLAAGAWSGQLLGDRCPPALRTSPCRGQMTLLTAPPGTLLQMVLASGDYLVPRADGRILVGATVEPGVADVCVTTEGIERLARFVARVAPGLAGAVVERSWSGLRPDTPDHLPVLGPVAGFEGLLAATGHYRSGIMLAPVTAQIIYEMVTGETGAVPRDLSPFRADRDPHATSKTTSASA